MLCSLFMGEGEGREEEEDKEGKPGGGRLPLVGTATGAGGGTGWWLAIVLQEDSGLVLWEEGEGCDLTGETVEEGGGGGPPSFTESPGLLLFIIFIMCSCSFCLESAFFSQSSCRMSCWVSGRVTVNLRNCWRMRGSSSGLHIRHFSRLLPCGSCKDRMTEWSKELRNSGHMDRIYGLHVSKYVP